MEKEFCMWPEGAEVLLSDSRGIAVYALDGKVTIAMTEESESYPDTPTYRQELIEDATEVLAYWESCGEEVHDVPVKGEK